ncbi:MAG TPA: hypothetical protein VI548_09840 [Chitinophagaceae bacterium]|nr:hypothetical protein [Chitinophagaceae bacterium]
MKDGRSLLLVLLSSGLVLTWVYHLYDKTSYSKRTREVFIKDSIAVAEAVSDSLKKIFSQSLEELETEKMQIDSNNLTLKDELGTRMAELNALKKEIGTILNKKNLTQSDLTEAREKIRDLQNRVESMRGENTSLAEEKKRLNGILAQLNLEVTSLQQNIQKVSAENEMLSRKVNEASVFVASEIKFTAVDIRQGQKEVSTNQIKRADKLVASFVVQNNFVDLNNEELVIVITLPSGKTLNDEVWDAGSFDTKTEGRKTFTRKMRFEYNKGEAKRLVFTIQPDGFEKGIYKLSIYHRGTRIADASWRLN